MDRRLSLLALLLLAGCGEEPVGALELQPPARVRGHRFQLASEDWAMEDFTVLNVGFWGSSAQCRVDTDPFGIGKGHWTISSISANRFFEGEDKNSDLLGPRKPETTRKLADPAQRGFARVVPVPLYGVRTGEPGGIKLLGAQGAFNVACVVYWVKPRTPDIPKGWVLAESALRLQELPVVHHDSYPNWRFDGEKLRWDLKSIDINPARPVDVSPWDAFESHLSRWSEKKPLKKDLGFFEMEPLVFAEVKSYTLKETATGMTKTGEILTGRIEAAGEFYRIGTRRGEK